MTSKNHSFSREIWAGQKAVYNTPNVLLGPMASESLMKDPKHFIFELSRYKFAAKMMKKCKHIIDIGCGEGIGSIMFLRETSANVTAIDFDEANIKYAKQNISPHFGDRLKFICQDIITNPYQGEKGDGLVCIDVIEHIHPEEEERFFQNCISSLREKCVSVFGTPNKYAKAYASPSAKKGHVNLFDPERLVSTLEKYFNHVFLFSMNDEIVHTGYNKMAHYLIAFCVR